MRAAGANGARLVDTMDELTEHVMTTDGTLQARVAARVADVAVAHGTSLLHARERAQLQSAHLGYAMRNATVELRRPLVDRGAAGLLMLLAATPAAAASVATAIRFLASDGAC